MNRTGVNARIGATIAALSAVCDSAEADATGDSG
jgi:hypothetical protein